MTEAIKTADTLKQAANVLDWAGKSYADRNLPMQSKEAFDMAGKLLALAALASQGAAGSEGR